MISHARESEIYQSIYTLESILFLQRRQLKIFGGETQLIEYNVWGGQCPLVPLFRCPCIVMNSVRFAYLFGYLDHPWWRYNTVSMDTKLTNFINSFHWETLHLIVILLMSNTNNIRRVNNGIINYYYNYSTLLTAILHQEQLIDIISLFWNESMCWND